MPDGMEIIDNTAGVMGDLDGRAERALVRVAMVVKTQAKANVRDRLNTTGVTSGGLMGSIEYVIRGKGFDSVARIGPQVVYGAIHEFGGVITPKMAPALVFQTADGEWHTVQSVTIPARPYLRPAVLDGRAAMAKAFAEEMGR